MLWRYITAPKSFKDKVKECVNHPYVTECFTPAGLKHIRSESMHVVLDVILIYGTKTKCIIHHTMPSHILQKNCEEHLNKTQL